MPGSTVIDFNQLPVATRRRIIDSTGPRPALAPLFADRVSTGSAIAGWTLFGLLGLAVLVLVFQDDFGRLGPGSNGIQQSPFLIAYACGVFCLVMGGFGIAFCIQRRRTLPFSPGRYLFPLDFVDARSGVLRIRHLGELADVRAVHHHTNGTYTHTSFTFLFKQGDSERFRVKGKAVAESLLRGLQQARSRVVQALREGNAEALFREDLFFEVRTLGGFEALAQRPPNGAELGPLAASMSPWLRWRWLIALGVGGLLGSGMWLARNHLSDSEAFANARAAGTGNAFREYVFQGGARVREAKELGGRADFDACEQHPSTDCWWTFLDRWTDSPWSEEVRKDRLPRAELKASSGSVSALRRFRARFPGSVVDAEARARIHQLFAGALASFQAQASTRDPALVPFMSKLLARLEATESTRVLVRFRRESSPSLARADRILGVKVDLAGQPVALASPHFDDAHTTPLEADIVQALASAFQRSFPNDVLTIEKGPALPEGGAAASEETPVLGIVYRVGWSGGLYSSMETGRHFVGITFTFDGEMRIPKEREPLRFGLEVHPPDHFSVSYTRSTGSLGISWGQGPADGDVYRVMALRAFDELGSKLYGIFFRSDGNASQPERPTGSSGALPPATRKRVASRPGGVER